MRGQLLGVDKQSGEGQVAGDDGQRYAFAPADWAGRGEPAVGQWVDFRPDRERATSLFPLPSAQVPASAMASSAAAAQRPRSDRDKMVAALLAFFLGALGVHRFYVGRIGSGVAMLILTLSVVGAIVSVPWALVDTLRYLMMTNREFAERYARSG